MQLGRLLSFELGCVLFSRRQPHATIQATSMLSAWG